MAKSIAIVTGASSGLGREFVKLLNAEANVEEIWAVARNEEKLAALKADYPGKIRTFSEDLSKLSSVTDIERVLKEETPNVAYLVNSAGYGKLVSYDGLDIAASVNMIDLNCSAVVAMGLACLPYMQRGAHIINIASMASFQPLPYLNIYAATKAFVRNYSRALNVELKSRGVSVTAVCPGWMKTAFIDRAQKGVKSFSARFVGMTTPDCVAKKAFDDAKRGCDISVYGLFTKFCHLTAKLLPQRVMMQFFLMQQRIKN